MPLTYKLCTDCGGGPWPPQRFYKKAKRKDGSYQYSANCKTCYRASVTEQRELKADHYRAYQQEYNKQPEVLAKKRQYKKTSRGKQVMRESRKAWAITHPVHHLAIVIRNQSVNSALRKLRRRAPSPQESTHETRTERRADEESGIGSNLPATG